MNTRNIFIIAIVLAVLPQSLMSVENAVGRTLPGMWVQPKMGEIAKVPGFSFTVMPIGFRGSFAGNGGSSPAVRQAPIAGELNINVSADVSENLLIPQFVYKTEHPRIGLATLVFVPVNYQVGSGTAGSFSQTFRSSGLADVFFSPLTLGIHFSENNSLAIDTKFFAPTGAFEIGNLSNLGMNVWTFTPNFAHTYFWKKRALEFDNYVAFDIYRENPTTRYKSGAVFHWDGLLLQYLSERSGLGAIVSNETQLNPDHGPLADRLNGFQGRAWGAGPMVMYVAKPRDPGLILQFRYIPEFYVRSLLKGYTLELGVTWKP